MIRPRIGIIDDEPRVRDAIAALVEQHDFEPVPLPGSAEYDALGPDPRLDLVLIDLQLRGESGLALAMRIRAERDLPIVMLTGTGNETDRIVGLEVGADDYLLKPFNPRELIARIRAVLRRYGRRAPPAPTRAAGSLGFGAMVLDTEARVLLDANGDEIALTNAEFRLLHHFLTHPDIVISRVDLLEEIGSDMSRYMDRTIDVLILRLRRKIEENPSKPVHLQTRRGKGYVFVTGERE